MGCKLISFIGFNDGFVGMISPVFYSEIWVEAGIVVFCFYSVKVIRELPYLFPVLADMLSAVL